MEHNSCVPFFWEGGTTRVLINQLEHNLLIADGGNIDYGTHTNGDLHTHSHAPPLWITKHYYNDVNTEIKIHEFPL